MNTFNSLPSPPESSNKDNSSGLSQHEMNGSSPAAASQSSPESSGSASSPAPNTTRSGTGKYLEDLSRAVLDVSLNQKDMTNPLLLKHMSATFRNKHDALPRAANRDDHHENISAHLASQPEFHVEVLNASSDVDNSRGRATVYLWYGISGAGAGRFEREAVAILSWERRQGLWQIVKHTGMRGPSGFW